MRSRLVEENERFLIREEGVILVVVWRAYGDDVEYAKSVPLFVPM